MNKTLRTILIVLAVLVGAAFVVAAGIFIVSGFGRGFLRHPMAMEGYHNFQSPDGRIPMPRMMSGYSPFGFFGGLLFRLAGFGLLAVLIGLLVWAPPAVQLPEYSPDPPQWGRSAGCAGDP